jgi:uncharacterized membrane protein
LNIIKSVKQLFFLSFLVRLSFEPPALLHGLYDLLPMSIDLTTYLLAYKTQFALEVLVGLWFSLK